MPAECNGSAVITAESQRDARSPGRRRIRTWRHVKGSIPLRDIAENQFDLQCESRGPALKSLVSQMHNARNGPRAQKPLQAHCTRGKSPDLGRKQCIAPNRRRSNQNSRACRTHDSVASKSDVSISGPACADAFICGICGICVICSICADVAPRKSGAEVFVSINRETNPSAPKTTRTSIEITVHTKGIRVRARSTCNMANVTISSSRCQRISKMCKSMHNT